MRPLIISNNDALSLSPSLSVSLSPLSSLSLFRGVIRAHANRASVPPACALAHEPLMQIIGGLIPTLRPSFLVFPTAPHAITRGNFRRQDFYGPPGHEARREMLYALVYIRINPFRFSFVNVKRLFSHSFHLELWNDVRIVAGLSHITRTPTPNGFSSGN